MGGVESNVDIEVQIFKLLCQRPLNSILVDFMAVFIIQSIVSNNNNGDNWNTFSYFKHII